VAGQEIPPEAEASSTCPVCGTEMVITRITPLLFGGEFEDLTLVCKKCGSTKKFRIKRAGQSAFSSQARSAVLSQLCSLL
jgi:DNA-directed RNA polymerase subunit M/transcription elongation factor TFIIS